MPGRAPDMQPQLQNLEQLFESEPIRLFLELKEQNIELKAEMRIHEAELQAKMEINWIGAQIP